MERTLYRIYLYFIVDVLLLFATIATAIFLAVLFQATPLNGTEQQVLSPDQIRQPAALAGVAWLTALTIGGLHYWLIRRNIRNEPGAAGGAVRAYFLNTMELRGVLVAAATGAIGLTSLAQPQISFAAPLFGIAFAFGASALLVELERRRSVASPGAAIIFQRLHYYGAQIILLVYYLTNVWTNALRQTVLTILVNSGLVSTQCDNYGYYGPSGSGPNTYCYVQGAGSQYPTQLGFLWAAVILVTVIWLLYGLMSRGDTQSRIRLVFHILSYMFSLAYLLVGIGLGIDFALRAALGLNIQPVDLVSGNSFLPPGIFGLLFAAAYVFLLLFSARRGGIGVQRAKMLLQAITAGILAIPFYVGCVLLLTNLVESIVRGSAAVSQESWAAAGAVTLTGIAYIPIALWLRMQTATSEVRAPRRGYVLTLLALGTLAGAVAVVLLLYTFITNLLGAPLPNWQQTARQGGVDLVVALVIVGIYLQAATSAGYLRRGRSAPGEVAAPSAPAQSPVPAPLPTEAPATQPTGDTLEGVLDALTAGTITREQAVARIRALFPA